MGFDELLDFGDGESVDALVNFFEGNDAIEEVEIASEGGGARGGGFLLHDERAFGACLAALEFVAGDVVVEFEDFGDGDVESLLSAIVGGPGVSHDFGLVAEGAD